MFYCREENLITTSSNKKITKKNSSLNFAKVRSLDMKNKIPWEKNLEDDPGLGSNSSAYWFRFRADNPRKDKINWILEIAYPLLDRIDLYIQDCNDPESFIRKLEIYSNTISIP